ncbi:MAG: right-handed parallel beta-helix repeat-containing protein, partial [Planctomycetota bacterium]
GGAIRNTSNSNPDIINCTFSENEATSGSGGGIFNDASSPTLSNSIVWGNTASDGNEIALLNTSTIDVNYCDIKDGNDGIYKEDSNCTVNWGTGNIDANPLFLADIPDQVRLLATSPCIDVGDNNAVGPDTNDIDNDSNTTEPLPWDLDGRPRFADGDCNTTDIVDMGAYEFTYAYIGDFAGGCDVDLTDFSILADYWLTDELLVDIAPTPAGDGIVDERDLAIFVDNWLEGL